MKMIEVDARGFSCPVPVMKADKAIGKNPKQAITVLVDNPASKDNVSRLARSKGYRVEVKTSEGGYCLTLTPA
ncbi:MAG: sulfurtransferase TusA family protein [Chloroflexota bacterium]